MKVYFNGFNLYRQFPRDEAIVEKFTHENFEYFSDFQVRHAYSVLLVADTVTLKSGKSEEQFKLSNISQISCNDDTILALFSNGELMKLTDNSYLPRLVFEPEDRIVKISCGATFSVAVSKLGCIFNIPNLLHYRNENIIDVKTGREHCLLLEQNGNVYSFGRGSRGQLGHGTLDDEIEPKMIEALGGIKIVAIATGGWHSCALSTDGVVYLWGWNGNGQLGLGTNDEKPVAVMATPQFLNCDFDTRKIACGVRHTVLLSDVGLLYGCGWNKYRQLKDESIEDFHQMTEMFDFSKEKVLTLNCGNWNTIVTCD